MEKLLTELRELCVHIPDNLDDAALLRHAKLLNPYTVTVQQVANGASWIATTRKHRLQPSEGQEIMDAVAYIDTTPHGAALNLLLSQLEEGKYTVADTFYKANAHQRNNQ